VNALVKPSMRGVKPYAAPARSGPNDLLLDLNEGAPLVSDAWLAGVARSLGARGVRRYPDASALESELAGRLGVEQDGVVVTNGGDDAIDRICRICLGPGDSIVLPTPSFEMIARSAGLAGGAVKRVPWMGGVFPVQRVIDSCDDTTRCVAVVSPNNPTGAVVSPEALTHLGRSLPGVLLMVDLAYTEFADVDLTGTALSLPNAVIVRTFSKAYGLAGLRLGYAVGPRHVVDAMRAAGGPFPCSALSLAAGGAALGIPPDSVRAGLDRVRLERREMASLLRSGGAEVLESQANFLLARFGDAESVWRALGERGIRVKRFADPAMHGWLRIGCPGDPADFARLTEGLSAVLRTREGAR